MLAQLLRNRSGERLASGRRVPEVDAELARLFPRVIEGDRDWVAALAHNPAAGNMAASRQSLAGHTVLTFSEELVLLLNDEDGTPLPIRQDVVACALAGTVLMDLAFANRIDTDLEALVVHDPTPTGSPVLDRILTRIAARTEICDTKTWIGVLSVEEAPAIQEQTLESLVECGVLKVRESKIPWTRSRRYPSSDGKTARELRLHIADVLNSDGIPDPRDVALISLLDACDVLPDIFPRQEIEDWHPRIALLRQMDLIGREVAGAIAYIERSIIQAVRARAAQFKKLLLILSIVAAVAALATLLVPRVPVPVRFGPTLFERLWFDGGWQLWSGYTLLGLSGAGLLAVLLVKVRAIARLGGFNWWRLAHVGFGIGCVFGLFAHTGFRLGANLNAALMVCFLAALILGGLAGVCTNGAGQLRKMGVPPKLRVIPMRLHIIALCPLPALLIIHVLVVYMY